MKSRPISAEHRRLSEDSRRQKNWKRWGPYLSERQWGTVREDYSPDGSSWDYFPHEHARSRVYRWGEDGLLGITDRECRLCFALALWNGRDDILKERLFGLNNKEGNHGEDVKECYFYLDSTPTHSYMKALYKYPQAKFPYTQLLEENARRGRSLPEYELTDTGVFNEGRYFDVTAEYAKADENDILIRITVANRGPDVAEIDLLPTLWFRNTWSFGSSAEPWQKPLVRVAGANEMEATHETLGAFRLVAAKSPDGRDPELLFTDNQTNFERLFNSPNEGAFVKDAFHDYVIRGRLDKVNPQLEGTKAAARYHLRIEAGKELVVRLRLFAQDQRPPHPLGPAFDRTFAQRIAEADEFYAPIIESSADDVERRVISQAYAGLLWTRQFYYYVIKDWLEGDPRQPAPPPQRHTGRNNTWTNLFNRNFLTVPDKWEYPWYAAWDLAFQAVSFARIDPDYAKGQLILLLREWFMSPYGQLPAYEYAFSDVNPPVHAWACWRVYKISAPRGRRDRAFLESAFQKLLLNFTWWVNRKDVHGRQIFSGGFLGMDNIGVLDRNRIPAGTLDEADATAWMSFFCVTMLAIALELAQDEPAYEDMASKFFTHFIAIVDAMNSIGGGLWDETDGMYYDQLAMDGRTTTLRVRSLVSLVPLLAVEVLDDMVIGRLKGFNQRMQWFLENRKDLARHISNMCCGEGGEMRGLRLLAIPSKERLLRVLRYMLDENEFLSPYGIRSLSKYHQQHPYVLNVDGQEYRVGYEPGDSMTDLFGGNSNWRGPIWMPVNYLLMEALERYHHFYRDSLKVEFPTGSGRWMNLLDVACQLRHRLASLFLRDSTGFAPWQGQCPMFRDDPHWKDMVFFHEFFHGDSGKGLGASHQTGWTALIARIMEDVGRSRCK